MFWMLLVGGRLVLPDRRSNVDPHSTIVAIGSNRATHWLSTPSLLSALLEISPLAFAYDVCNCGWRGDFVRTLLHSGQDRIRNPNSLTNTGRLEATVWTTCVNLDLSLHLSSPNQRIPNAGAPISNTRLYVLDEWLEPVPIGVSGELYIGGLGLARGYLKRAGLTAQRFIANPFGEGERLYCTGDLVRYRADGNLEFIGRRDDQVKVRGYRIELGEVESALLSHAGVSQAVVVARQEETGEKRLVGYVVGDDAIDVLQMREHLKSKLPIYMVPGALVQLERMPLSANGKIDRKAFAGAGGASANWGVFGAAHRARASIGRYLEPKCYVLCREQVGIEDNFFELGGHSLLAMRVVAQVRESFAVEVELRAVFEAPTLAGLAQRVEELCGRSGGSLRRSGARGTSRAGALVACTGALVVLGAVGVGGHGV